MTEKWENIKLDYSRKIQLYTGLDFCSLTIFRILLSTVAVAACLSYCGCHVFTIVSEFNMFLRPSL